MVSKKLFIVIFIVGITAVTVGGIFIFKTNTQYPKLQYSVRQDEIVETSSDSDIQQAMLGTQEIGMNEIKWQTFYYRDISFNYPDDWTLTQLDDSGAGIALRSPQYAPIKDGNVIHEGEIYINILRNPKDLSIEDLFRTFSDFSRFLFDRHHYEDVSYNGLTGVKFLHFTDSTNPSPIYETAIYLQGTKKIISLTYVYKENKEEYQEILEAIARSLTDDSK